MNIGSCMVRVCRRAFAPLVCIACVAAAGCASQDRGLQQASETETRAHLAEEARFQDLRQRMRGIVRQFSLELPLACDSAITGISDFETRSDLLALAGSGGIFAFARCAAPDPRTGLADLIVMFATLSATFESYATDPGYASLSSVIAVVKPAAADFSRLGDAWLSDKVRAQVQQDIADAIREESARVHGATRSTGVMASKVNVPASFQIRSSFLNFNDNGLLEYALGEAHFMRLSAQQIADATSLLPLAMEYHGRRAALWAMQDPQVTALETRLDRATAELDSLKSLDALRSLTPLEQLSGLPWKVGAALVAGLVLQGVIVGFALRRGGAAR